MFIIFEGDPAQMSYVWAAVKLVGTIIALLQLSVTVTVKVLVCVIEGYPVSSAFRSKLYEATLVESDVETW